MGIFDPPIGNKTILDIEGVSGNTFEVNAEGTNPYTRVELFAKNDWPNTDEEQSTLMVESYKDLGSGDIADAYFYALSSIDETDGDPTAYMLLQTGDKDNNWFYHEFDVEVDKIYYWMEGLNPYIRVDNTNEYIKIIPTSIVFNDGTDDVAEFSTTSIQIGTTESNIGIYGAIEDEEDVTFGISSTTDRAIVSFTSSTESWFTVAALIDEVAHAATLNEDSLTFTSNGSTVAEFATTGITIGDGHVPVYWGESATEPATYQPGNFWYDTSSTGELKMYITSVGWITIGTP